MSLHAVCSLVNGEARNLQVKYELHNSTDKTLYVCRYYTPLESIKNAGVFKVYNNSKKCDMEYHGIMARRIAPTAEHYQKIDPKETVSNIVLLSNAYQITSKQEYAITPRTDLLVIDDLNNLNSKVSVPCTSNTLTVLATM